MKKGFTLIEMIAVVIILGLLALIAIPLVEDALSDVKDDAYNTQIESIRSSAREWAADHISLLPLNDKDTYVTTLGNLKSGGYIKTEIVNPKTKEDFLDSFAIVIINDNGNYVYSVGGDSGGQIDPNSPRITINGDTLVYVDQYSVYSDLGAVAKGSDGTRSVILLLFINGSIVGTIGTTDLDTYQIIYSAVSGGITTKVSRTLIIKDTVAPVLNIPGDVSIDDTVTSYNIMTGVSSNDNSGVPPVIKTKTNLTLGVVGHYLVTYTSTDNAGNVTVKERIITITY